MQLFIKKRTAQWWGNTNSGPMTAILISRNQKCCFHKKTSEQENYKKVLGLTNVNVICVLEYIIKM